MSTSRGVDYRGIGAGSGQLRTAGSDSNHGQRRLSTYFYGGEYRQRAPLPKKTGGHTWISVLAAISTAIALVVLCVEVDENPATRNHLWILLGMVVASFAIEIGYRRLCSELLSNLVF